MPCFKARAEIEMDIEARDEEGAKLKAETILLKRVLGQSFGHRRNDNGEVVAYRKLEVEPDPDYPEERDLHTPGPSDCPDCGEIGELRGHYGCQYPSNDPNIEGLEDPMQFER
jgi:hypothetical protein